LSTLNSYAISHAPTNTQLKYANTFFTAAEPTYLFTAPFFRSYPPSPFPEVAFLGRSNVGKSSLLNAIFGRTSIQPAHVSKRPGRTRTMNGFGVSGGAAMGLAPKEGEREVAWKRFPRGGLVVVDMPGYGGGSREEWGKEVMKYLENRAQLRRAFVLVDAEHGLKSTDVQLLVHLRRQGIAHQVVLSKADKVMYPGSKAPGPQKVSGGLLKLRELCGEIRQTLDREAGDGRRASMDILCCSAQKSLDPRNRNRKLGVDEVRWAILSACGLECDEYGTKKKSYSEDMTILDDEG
jgi:GTP-binding protein